MKIETKTIRQWFEDTLPREYAERAIKNTSARMLSDTAQTITSALSGAFKWEKTPEGSDFWDDVYGHFAAPKLPPIPKTKEEELADFVVQASKDPFMPNDMNARAIELVKKYSL